MEEDQFPVEPVLTDLPFRDEAAALQAAGGDAELAEELVQSLVQGLPKELSHLEHCFQANDWSALAEAVHKMRGATGYCGVPALDHRLLHLERAAKTGDRDGILARLRQVQQAAERLIRKISGTKRE